MQKVLTVTLSEEDTSEQFFPPEITLTGLSTAQRNVVDAIRLQCIEDEVVLENGTIVRDERHAILWLLEAIDAAPESE